MLEGFTTLGYLAALTGRARLGLMVGGIHYRQAGLWLKARDHARRAVRRTRLVRHRRGLERGGIARGWASPCRRWRSGSSCSRRRCASSATAGRVRRGPGPRSRGRTYGRHGCSTRRRRCRGRTLRSWSGAAGELRTLRLVARHADACNVFGSPDQVRHKYAVLREHCATEGRDYDTIEKTNLSWISHLGRWGAGVATPHRPGGAHRGLGGGRLDAHDREHPQRLGPGQAGAHRTRRDPPDPRTGDPSPLP